jgi:hypothetical protein
MVTKFTQRAARNPYTYSERARSQHVTSEPINKLRISGDIVVRPSPLEYSLHSPVVQKGNDSDRVARRAYSEDKDNNAYSVDKKDNGAESLELHDPLSR